MRVMRMAVGAAILGALALPGTALAVDTTSEVTGTVDSELSLSVEAPAAMAITHATPGVSSSLVTVTSTAASWTLSIKDAGLTTPGRMDRLTGAGPTSLTNPLQWKLNGSSSYNDLTGTAATVTTGSLVGTALVDFRQPLDASEDVQVADTYGLTVTYTVT